MAIDSTSDYFDTPARAERLQLLLHLVRNAGEVLYLRAPTGSGKTRFAHQLLDILGDELAAVWVQADANSDIPMVTVDQLGLAVEEASPWPEAVMAGLAGQDLLMIVDDADWLGLEAVESLALLHARGGRLLLVGQGGLAQTNGNWDVQFVDLPSFDAAQTTAFLRAQAGEHATRVTDDLAAGLHRAAKGLPGPLLDALTGVLGNAGGGRRAQAVAVPVAETPRRPLWPWAFGGLVLILLLSVLLFQDQVNALFTPPEAQLSPGSIAMEPTEKLRAEAVSALMPEIRLPELSEETTLADVNAMATAAGPEPGAGAGVPDPASSREPGRTAVEADPLEAVMQDAIDAQPAESRPEGDPLEAVMQDAIDAQPAESKPEGDPLDAVMQDALAAAEAGKEQVDAGSAVPAEAHEVISEPAVEPVPPTTEPPDSRETRAATAAAPAAVVATTRTAQAERERAARAEDPVKKPGERLVVEEPLETESQLVPAPVETRQPAPPETTVVQRTTRVPAPPAAVASTGGISWLKARAPDRYTLQLVGSRDRAAVQKFVRDFAIEAPYAIFERDLKGKPWYSLVAGDYPDRNAAIAARAQLPKRLERSGIWPRTFDSVQKSL